MDDKWHWVRPLAGGEFECARVDYLDNAPFQVWFTGMSKSRPASDCEIGPEIEPMKAKP
jgi:hypothetical protein